MRLRSLVPLYTSLVLVLAGLGMVNQERHQHQASLIELKADLHTRIASLRAQAAQVSGPLAVGAWARSKGMVPSPDVTTVRHAAAYPAPETTGIATGLEVRTRWQ